MWVKSWMKSALLRAPEGEGAGGDAPAPAAPTAGQDAAPKVPSSLFDMVDQETDTAAAPAADGGKPADADATGKSQRPDWLPEQFWDAEKGPQWEKLAQSHQDLRRQLGKGDHKPPATADAYKLPQLGEKPILDVPADDPALKAFRDAAHAQGLSQGQFDALIAPVLATLAEAMPPAETPETRQAAYKAELQKLGTGGAGLVKAVGQWGRGLFQKEALTADEWEEFQLAAGTAAGVRMLSKLRDLAGEKSIPMDPMSMSSSVGSMAEVEALYKEKDFDTSPEKQRKAQEMINRLIANGTIR